MTSETKTSEANTIRELSAGELDIVGGGHGPGAPPETISQSLQRLPGRAAGLADAAAGLPAGIVNQESGLLSIVGSR